MSHDADCPIAKWEREILAMIEMPPGEARDAELTRLAAEANRLTVIVAEARAKLKEVEATK